MKARPRKPRGPLTFDGSGYRGCGRKNAYSRKQTAMQVARRIRRQTGEDIRHYRCDRCGSWHIGHAPGTRRAQ